MKIIFYIPAYAAFYENDLQKFSEVEIDRAAQEHRALFAVDYVDAKAKEEVVYVMDGEPRFEFDSTINGLIEAMTPSCAQILFQLTCAQWGREGLARYLRGMRMILERNAE
jgi:hypothetical protein